MLAQVADIRCIFKEKMNLKYFLLFIISITGIKATCQTQSYFHIDERRVLLNENLDFFVNKLKSQHFTIHKGKQEIPSFIKEQLPFISDRNIANPDEKFEATDEIMDTSLPTRQLVFLCSSEDIYVVTYGKGGIGFNWKMLFIKYANKKVLDVWVGTTFCSNLTSVKNILDCIDKNRKKDMGLNTNIVDY